MIDTRRFSEEQVVSIIYGYLVLGMSGKEICMRYMDMTEKQVGNSRTAYQRFEGVYHTFGFMKKYGGKPWQGINRNKLADYVSDYWPRGASEAQMLDYFPELRDALEQAKREEGKAPTGHRNSSGHKTTSSPRTRNYYDDEDDYNERNTRDTSQSYVNPYAVRTPGYTTTGVRTSIGTKPVSKPATATVRKSTPPSSDVYKQMMTSEPKKTKAYDVPPPATLEYGKGTRTHIDRDTDLLELRRRNRRNTTSEYDDLGRRNRRNTAGFNEFDFEDAFGSSGSESSEGAGYIAIFIVVGIIIFALWKFNIFGGIFGATKGIFGIILTALEVFFFYGGIILAIIGIFKRILKYTWPNCLAMVLIGLGFGSIHSGSIIVGIVLIVAGGFLASMRIKRE